MAASATKSLSLEQEQELDDVFARARAALAIIETYDQDRVDRLIRPSRGRSRIVPRSSGW